MSNHIRAGDSSAGVVREGRAAGTVEAAGVTEAAKAVETTRPAEAAGTNAKEAGACDSNLFYMRQPAATLPPSVPVPIPSPLP